MWFVWQYGWQLSVLPNIQTNMPNTHPSVSGTRPHTFHCSDDIGDRNLGLIEVQEAHLKWCSILGPRDMRRHPDQTVQPGNDVNIKTFQRGEVEALLFDDF